MSKLLKLFLAVLVVVSCSQKEEEAGNADYNLTIESADGRKTNLSVENAVSPEELQKGLMNRESLGEKHGMIFNLKGYEHVAMWMKDTKIPLDMIFVNDGVVVWVYENAQPNSTQTISSPKPADAVIELNAGDAKKYDIKAGDIVRHAFFDNFAAPADADTKAGDKIVSDENAVDADVVVEDISEEEALADDGASGETVIEETTAE